MQENTIELINKMNLLDLLLDVRYWASKHGYIVKKIDSEGEKYFTITSSAYELNWLKQADALYKIIAKDESFAIKEKLIKKTLLEEGKSYQLRITGRAILKYGHLLNNSTTPNSIDYDEEFVEKKTNRFQTESLFGEEYFYRERPDEDIRIESEKEVRNKYVTASLF